MKNTSFVGVHIAIAITLLGCGSSNTEAPAGSDGGPAVADSGGDSQATASSGSGPFEASKLTPQTWTWIPVDGAICRDGSKTGFGVSVGTETDKLMIYLEGGGACFNALTCGM